MTDVVHAIGDSYRSNTNIRQLLLRHSRNLSIHGDQPQTRTGYKIRKQLATPSGSATYVTRIPTDEANAALRYAVLIGSTIRDSALASQGSLTNDVYDAITNQLPSFLHMLGRTILIDGLDYRLLFQDGSTLKVKIALDEPSDPALLIQSGGAMTVAETFVRVEHKDDETGTQSGPNDKSGTAGSITLTGGNQAIRVTPASFPSRATHWRIGSATLDTPASYEIHEDAKDAVGGTKISDANGWIPVASTVAYIDVDPTSGLVFPFRTVGSISLFRHSTPPLLASYVVHYQGRAWFASSVDTWLVFSETGNIEHFFHDPTNPDQGFNTLRGDSLVDSIVSPCTGLAATNNYLLFFMRAGIVLVEGSFALVGASPDFRRDGQAYPVSENSVGCNGAKPYQVDQEIYFLSDDGPKVFSGNGVLDLDGEAVRADWRCRDPVYDHRGHIGYDPDTKQVLFTFVSKLGPITGVPSVVLPWHMAKRRWATPWDLDVSSWVLHRGDDGGVQGVRLFMGLPYGSQAEFGFGYADGDDAVGADFDEKTATGQTSTTVTKSDEAFTTDEFFDHSVAILDRSTGRLFRRTIKSNTATVLTWEGAVTDTGGGFIFAIAGIPVQWHGAETAPGKEMKIVHLVEMHRDVMSTEA